MPGTYGAKMSYKYSEISQSKDSRAQDLSESGLAGFPSPVPDRASSIIIHLI